VEPEVRNTGIGAVGDVPWGTHFFLFYETKEDLLDTLVPYFKAGLESGEFCVWVVSEPLTETENEFATQGTAMPTFCDLCQLPLSAGTPRKNSANVLEFEAHKYIFCSEPCRWIFLKEPERYANHRELVKRVLSGEAPAALPDLLTKYFGLTPETWGKDVRSGRYEWLAEKRGSAP
jgi:YHS domain-containing protein